MSSDALLSGVGIRKTFGGLNAVDGVDINIYPGEIVGLIGPNGSGKTTLFDCLSRVQDVSAGSVFFKGKNVTKLSPHRLAHLGMARTFQILRVYRELTVLENMELSLQWANVDLRRLLSRSDHKVTKRADQLIEFLMLSKLRDELAGTLSGGQRRLLELGMALMSEPELVLLDEAMSGVNPSLVEQIKQRLLTINNEFGVGFLLVEHNISFIKDLCSRVMVLNYGTKLAEGSPTEIMANSAVIEAYFGSASQTGGADHE